ncbi:hypothetical protein BST24_23005 [Mycobacteroides franklinii]|nr:hypothetical protein BST24_23005 [Mycobacteroides franklinii]
MTLLTRNAAVRTHILMGSEPGRPRHTPGVNRIPRRHEIPVCAALAGPFVPGSAPRDDESRSISKYRRRTGAGPVILGVSAVPGPPRPHPYPQIGNRPLPSIDGPGLPPDSYIGSPDKPGRDSG